MSFADIPETKKFAKAEFLSTDPGKPVMIQFVDDRPERFLCHTVKSSEGWFVKILHDESKAIIRDPAFNEKYRPSWRFRVNVLDVTPSVKNPKTGNVYPAMNNRSQVPERDTDGTNLREIEPEALNEVKILEKGIQFFQQVNGIVDALSAGNPNFDVRQVVFMIQRTGSGRQTQYSIIPMTHIKPQPVVDENGDELYEKFDLAISDFSEEEIMKILSGTKVQDIYKARRSVESEELDFNSDSDGGLDFSSGIPGL